METAATNRQMEQKPFEELYRKHYQLIYRAAYSVTGSREEAEDALQNVFLGLIESGFQPESTTNLKGYLYRAAVNEALMIVRSRRQDEDFDYDVELESVEDPACARKASGERMRDSLLDAIAMLDPHEVAMLIISYDHGYSDAEIAEMLGQPRSTVASTLRRIRARLKEFMTGELEDNK